MNKIDTFRITGLTAEGFKCFAEKQTFSFGGMNSITGHNGQGKSSIADAIAFAIAGTPFFGAEQNLDRLYAIESKDAMVELDIQDGSGQYHKLTRSRVKDVTSITYDGVSVRQTDLTDMFGERDVFLSIFNPLYFIEVLGDKGKNLLERYLPSIPHEKVIAQLSEESQRLLGSVQMNSPEALLERVRSDMRELESTIIYVEGQRDLLESQAKEKEETLNAKRKELAAAENSASALEAKRTAGFDASDMQEKRNNLYMRYDELSRDILSPPDTSEIDTAILSVQTALEKRRAEQYISKFARQIAEASASVTQLRELYNKEKAIHEGLTAGIQCPMCKQEITEQNIGGVKKAFADSINDVLLKGREQTTQLGELNTLDEKAKAVFEQFKSADIAKLEADLGTLTALRAETTDKSGNDAEDRRAELDHIKGEIQAIELDLEHGSLMPDEAWELEGLQKKREKLQAEISVLMEAADAGTETKDADIESLRQTIGEKRELETAVKFYIAERTRLMVTDFDVLKRVDIVLNEVVKTTGEVKNVFKFSYDGKPYKYLSLSEKIKAGLEVSELMKRLTCRNYPAFIDNGESVPVIDNIRPTGQVFIAQVAKGAPLTVEIIGGQRDAAPNDRHGRGQEAAA